MLIEAAKPLNYGRRIYRIGDRFEATKQHAWLLVAVGKCIYPNIELCVGGAVVARQFHTLEVAGSNPAPATNTEAEPPKRKRGRPRKVKEVID